MVYSTLLQKYPNGTLNPRYPEILYQKFTRNHAKLRTIARKFLVKISRPLVPPRQPFLERPSLLV